MDPPALLPLPAQWEALGEFTPEEPQPSIPSTLLSAISAARPKWTEILFYLLSAYCLLWWILLKVPSMGNWNSDTTMTFFFLGEVDEMTKVWLGPVVLSKLYKDLCSENIKIISCVLMISSSKNLLLFFFFFLSTFYWKIVSKLVPWFLSEVESWPFFSALFSNGLVALSEELSQL